MFNAHLMVAFCVRLGIASCGDFRLLNHRRPLNRSAAGASISPSAGVFFAHKARSQRRIIAVSGPSGWLHSGLFIYGIIVNTRLRELARLRPQSPLGKGRALIDCRLSVDLEPTRISTVSWTSKFRSTSAPRQFRERLRECGVRRKLSTEFFFLSHHSVNRRPNPRGNRTTARNDPDNQLVRALTDIYRDILSIHSVS